MIRRLSLRPVLLSITVVLSLALVNSAPAAAQLPATLRDQPPQSGEADPDAPLSREQELAALTSWARDLLSRDPNMPSSWLQVNAPIQNVHWQRYAENYRLVIDQFNVQYSHQTRYGRGGGGIRSSRCNIFAGDVMRAMGAPLPTKGELGVGHGNQKYTDTMTANATDLFNWLNAGYGQWYRIDPNNPNDLGRLLDQLKDGKPTLAVDLNHIAVVRPDHLPTILTLENLGDLRVAQAGAFNYNDRALRDVGYGDKFKPVFFVHE